MIGADELMRALLVSSKALKLKTQSHHKSLESKMFSLFRSVVRLCCRGFPAAVMLAQAFRLDMVVTCVAYSANVPFIVY